PGVGKLVRDGYLLGRHHTPAGFTTTAPIVLAMGTGAPAEAQQFLNNFNSPAFPGDSIFRVLKQHGLSTAVFGEKIWADLYGAHIDRKVVYPDTGMADLYTHDREAYHAALDHSAEADFAVVHFVGADHAGHRLDFADPEYRDVSRALDSYISGLIARSPERHFIVTADHGMSRDRTHVRPEPMVVEPPFLCVGPRCPRDRAPNLSTLALAPFITGFFGAGPPASATELPPRDLLALGPAQEAAFTKAFVHEVIERRRNVAKVAAEPGSWSELSALNQSTLRESRLVVLSSHAAAVAMLFAGLIGIALYRLRPRHAWLIIPVVLGSWLWGDHIGALGLMAAALLLVALARKAIRLADLRIADIAAAGAAVLLVSAPLAIIDDRLTLSALPRFAPVIAVCGALFLGLLAILFKRALLWPVGALGVVWSMFFLAHRWPQGAAVFAVTALSIAGIGWLIHTARRSSSGARPFPRHLLLGAALAVVAWAPFYIHGGAPSAFDGIGSGLHIVPESPMLRGATATLFAGFLLWLCSRRRGLEMQVYSILALAAPVLAFTRNGFTSEMTALGVYGLMIVIATSRQARIAAAAAALFLVSSSAQALALVIMAWGFALLGPSLRRSRGAGSEWLAAVLLSSCFYILGMTFHAGRIETVLSNPDLVATSALWLAFTVGLVVVKVSLAVILLLASWTAAECLEGPLLRFAWLSAVPLMLLYQRGYAMEALTITPVILLFTGAVLISRLILSIPAPFRLFGLRPARPGSPEPAPAR
ncbi:MAG TPA: alkaline phosphatase family protein, partial [Polyangiaceae bacterium]|nr:alkaline phosphatase family protein [Polyangiaceae bacterium]